MNLKLYDFSTARKVDKNMKRNLIFQDNIPSSIRWTALECYSER